VVAAVQALHGAARTLDDAQVRAIAPRAQAAELPARAPIAPDALRVPGERLLMVGYTSGSTGQPAAHDKLWGSVLASTRLNAEAIRATLPPGQRALQPTLVGTVPSQHMYGMELTVLLPLLAGWRLHGARPLLPQDVAGALAQAPAPRVLVSTPAHLRAIVASGVRLPEVAVTISATAPLDAALATDVEACTGGTLLEMFGSTETCIFAYRRTAHEQDWHAYEGLRLAPDDDGTLVDAPWFPRPQRLQDILDVPAPGRFRLRGRNSDMVDVAGKRASLAELTARLLAIPGVRDAAVFQPDAAPGPTALVRRLAAMVAAPGVGPAQIRAALAHAIDPVFMPRPLLMVTALPRTAAGKLPRVALLEALAAHEAQRRRDP
jgi:acyl-coenzyme A synthetase/AMP-(fatty) acid ligase